MIKTPEKDIYKGEGGRWAGTEVGGYRGGEVQRWRGTEGGEVQKVRGYRRREGLEGEGRF